MESFNQLYKQMLKSAVKGEATVTETDAHLVDKLLHPEKHAPVWQQSPCDCKDGEEAPCTAACLYKAIRRDETGALMIDESLCVGCSACIQACKSGKLTQSKDILPVLEAVKKAPGTVYAMVAPSIIGQFGEAASAGRLRCAFKKIGFADMAEVALFADILTLKEALLFDREIITDTDYMLTSCCCPIWIAMVRRGYKQFVSHLPDLVSPMVACARVLKRLDPKAVTVFIGPCIAKKVEAREKDLQGIVDFVLTFEEMKDLFDAFEIDMAHLTAEPEEQSSRAGRIYGRTGGVSEAVSETVRRLRPGRHIVVKAVQADGTAACRKLLDDLKNDAVTANYLEGMGCDGGCVGGPKVLIEKDYGRRFVNDYGDEASFATPLENPAVLSLLKSLGFETAESLIEDEDIFVRQF
ncbi:4Fe-4S binding protein [Oscillospiraceae bacterium CM]|nr:4Fe-4S binding protein [Oscillospiraceae bacterium CM]